MSHPPLALSSAGLQVASYGLEPADSRLLASAAPPMQYALLHDVPALRRHLLSHACDVLVLGLDHLHPDDCAAAVTIARAAALPIVVRIAHTPPSAARLVTIAELVGDCHASIRGFDDLSRDAQQAALRSRRHGRAATHHMLKRLSDLMTPAVPARHIVVAAALIGDRQRRVQDLVPLCRMSSATINRTLRVSGLVSANALLASTLCVHAAYLVDHVGLRVVHVSRLCGFHSRTGFDDFLRRHAGYTPATIARLGMSEELLAGLSSRLRRAA